jgi:hypothetical protein
VAAQARGVLIIAGHLFFPGLEDDAWAHKHECIRVSYGSLTDDDTLREGMRMIATEAARSGRGRGRHARRMVLEAILRPNLAGDTAMLGAWF